MKFRILAMILACLLLVMGVASCSKKGDEPSDISEEQTTQSEPKEPKPEDTTDYEAVLRFQFDGLAETPASDFTYTLENGGVKILSYTGDAEKVRVPFVIDGNTVTAIGDGVFAEQKQLKVLYIPDGVKNFGKAILKDCERLYALHTPFPQGEGTTFLGYLYGATDYTMNNTAAMRSLDYLEIGGSMMRLPDYALYDCNDLIVLKLPDSVKILGEYSLYRCESLKYVNTESLTDVEAHAMAFCMSLEKLTFTAYLQRIGLGALENCDSLRRLTIPFVGETRTQNTFLGYVFGAENYGSAEGFYPSALEFVTVTMGIDKLGDHAFYECSSLREIVLPDTVKSIGVRAFSGCENLVSVDLPDAVQKLGDAAFSNCSGLERISLGSQLQELGVNCFLNCISLKEIVLPDSVRALPNSCFSGCKSLTTVSLGGVASVGANAFYGCEGLQSVSATQGKIVFEDGNELVENLIG